MGWPPRRWSRGGGNRRIDALRLGSDIDCRVNVCHVAVAVGLGEERHKQLWRGGGAETETERMREREQKKIKKNPTIRFFFFTRPALLLRARGPLQEILWLVRSISGEESPLIGPIGTGGVRRPRPKCSLA